MVQYERVRGLFMMEDIHAICLDPISFPSGSDVACLSAKHSAKSHVQQVKLHTHKQSMHALTSCVCVLTSLSGGREMEYSDRYLEKVAVHPYQDSTKPNVLASFYGPITHFRC